jgi:hypothetical protein
MPATYQKTDPTYRTQHRFWLDTNRQDERELAEYIVALKEKRTFISTLRDALRLIRDLRQGRVEVLLGLFPWVADYFKAQARLAHVPSPVPDFQLTLQAHLDRVEKLLSSRSVVEGNALSPIPPTALLPRQSREEIDIEITVVGEDEEAGKRATQNFMRSLMAIQNLPSTPPVGSKAKKTQPKKQPGDPRKLEVPILDAPTFDDSDLEHLLE